MAVAIKRVIQFSYAKMNSVQSEQTRIRAKNKYKNDHICEEFKKFNLHPINNTEGLTYNQYFKKYCKRRTGGKKKVDVVSEMGKKDFYLDKLYTGKGGGKTTCCVESMVISLNDRIDATEEAIKAYQEDPDNQQKMDAFVTYITKSDPRFKDCRFLNVDWHFDEVYTPYEKKPPTEEFPDGEIVVGTPKISIHAHITYIPLAKDIDKNGKEYLNLNRGAIWKSRTAAYNQSYSQFNDDIYEEVERKFGYDRGELYPASEKDRNEDMNIQDWIIVHNGEMAKQYKAQEQLKLMTEKEKTQIKRKEFGETHKKKIESAKEEINHIQKSINELKKDYDYIKTEHDELNLRIGYKKLCRDGLVKQIEEKEAQLKHLTEEENNKTVEIANKQREYDDICRAVKDMIEEKTKKEKEVKEAQKELDEDMDLINDMKRLAELEQEELDERTQDLQESVKIADDTIKIFAYIEAAIRKKQLTPEKAVSIIEKNKQEDILQAFDNLEAKELTPELYNMANMIKNKEIGEDGSR